MNQIKPCPLCGGEARLECDKRIIPPVANMYGDAWFGSFRIQIVCEPCMLRMDVAFNDDYKSEEEALRMYDEVTDAVISMWNRREA